MTKTVVEMLADGEYEPKLAVPIKPRKPQLKANMTSVEARDYADKLDQYDEDILLFHDEMNQYRRVAAELKLKFRDDLEKEEGVANNPKAELLWNIVYNRVGDDMHQFIDLYEDLVPLIK